MKEDREQYERKGKEKKKRQEEMTYLFQSLLALLNLGNAIR